jgi:hypothetical protein
MAPTVPAQCVLGETGQIKRKDERFGRFGWQP